MKEIYKRYLKISESSRYEGFDEYLECINKSQIAEDYKSLKETIAKVQAAVNKLLMQEKWNQILSKFITPTGFTKNFTQSLYGKFESAVKKVHRVLNDAEVENAIKKTAIEESLETQDKVTCIEDEFNINDFILHDPPVMNPMIKSNLQRLHSEIVVPIMKYYKSTGEIPEDDKCRFKVVAGLVKKKDVVRFLKGTAESPHTKGLAIDFYISDLKSEKVFKDLCDKKIKIEWGVLILLGSSIHITLPYNKFKNFILSKDTKIEPFSTGFSFAGKVIGKLFN